MSLCFACCWPPRVVCASHARRVLAYCNHGWFVSFACLSCWFLLTARGATILIFGLPPDEEARFTGSDGTIGAGGEGGSSSDMSISYAHLTKNLCVPSSTFFLCRSALRCMLEHAVLTVDVPPLLCLLLRTYLTSHITPVDGNTPMPVFDMAMDMLADGRIDVAPLVTHTFQSTDFAEAYDNASNYGEGVIKTMIVWNDKGVDAPPTDLSGFRGGVSAAGAAAVSQCAPCKFQPTKL